MTVAPDDEASSILTPILDGPVERPTFTFRELDKEDGTPSKTIAVSDFNIQPLNYAELAAARLHERLAIPIELRDATVVATDIEGLDKSRSYVAKATLESIFTSRAIGLVKGGWLPSALAAVHSRTTVLLDRNVVSEIVARFDGGRKIGGAPDFLDLFADQPVRINPLLFAMEGNAKAVPTPELIRDQLEEAATKLKTALPLSELVIGPESLRGAIGLVEESRPGIVQKQRFLLRVAPTLTAPVSRRDMHARWESTVTSADECGVSRNSLVVLAALSSVVVPNGRSSAKRLLKFRPAYSEADAYNALADLRSLDILMCLLALFPNEPMQLCTADKDLALFWTGIQASSFKRTRTSFSFDLSPVEELLPGPWLDEWRSCVAARADAPV